MMSAMKKLLFLTVGVLGGAIWGAPAKVVDVSRVDPHYFETADGRTFVPVGVNLVSGVQRGNEASLRRYEGWLEKFAANGGNWIRIWLSAGAFETMPKEAGVFDPAADEVLKRVMAKCEKLGIKVKFTLEHFRSTLADSSKARQPWANRTLYAPYSNTMHDFFTSEQCMKIYLERVNHLKELGFGDSPSMACWEPWNEINAAGWVMDYAPWSDRILAELARLFPKQMVTQNLGSYSSPAAYGHYEQMAGVNLNAYMQIHRYLDPGAQIDVCRGPMDVLAAEAIREMRELRPDRPAVLAETGAVEANHAGASHLYKLDKQGTMMHDLLFAPFFAGGAGCGQLWHWDSYIDANNLWYHFARFAKAIEGLDPAAEHFRPFRTETARLRVYGLRGQKTTVIWCRDKKSTWETEVEKGVPPQTVQGERLPFANCTFACYLPWEDKAVSLPAPALPAFTRSIVVRFPTDPAYARIIEPH